MKLFEPPATTWQSWQTSEKPTFLFNFAHGLRLRMVFHPKPRDYFAWIEFRQFCCEQGTVLNSATDRCPWCSKAPFRPPTLSAAVGWGPKFPSPDLSTWLTPFFSNPLEATLAASETVAWLETFFETYCSEVKTNGYSKTSIGTALAACGVGEFEDDQYPF